MDFHKFIVSNKKEESISIQRVSDKNTKHVKYLATAKGYTLVCSPSEDMYQPAHPCSLMQSSLDALWVTKVLMSLLISDSQDSDDKSEWMCRLI